MNILSDFYFRMYRAKFFYWEIIKKSTFRFKLRHLFVLLRKLWRAAIGKKLQLRKIFLGVTYRCQCSCPHCLAGFYAKDPLLELSEEEIKKVIDSFKEVNPLAITFFGGEPLLRKGIEGLISYASSKGYVTELETNGLLLDKEKVKELKKAGLNRLWVSLDDSRPQEHDRLRGVVGCYERAINALGCCVKEGLSCGINTYATKEKIRDGILKEIIRIGQDIRVNDIFIIFPTCTGRWLFNEEAALDKEDILRVKEFFTGLVNNWMRVKMPLSGTLHFKCAVLEKITCYISPYGQVQPCCFMPFSFGNIRESALLEILGHMQQHPMLKEAQIIKDNDCMMNNRSWRAKYIHNLDFNKTNFPINLHDK